MARLIRWFLIAAMLLPATAYAAPVVIAAIAYGASSLAVAAGYSAAAAAFIGAIAAATASAIYANNTKPGRQTDLPTFQAEAKDRQTMVRSAVEPRRIVYGTVSVSGPIVYIETTGVNNKFMHLVIPLAGHEVEAIDAVYADDEFLPIASNGDVQGRWRKTAEEASHTGNFDANGQITVPGTVVAVYSVVVEGAGITAGQRFHMQPAEVSEAGSPFYSRSGSTFTIGAALPGYALEGALVTIHYVQTTGASYMRVKKHLGADDQVADADLVAESGAQWTSDHRLRGIAYIYVRMEWNEDVFPTGIPNFKAVVRGKKVLDPRTSPATTAWSENWALCVRDYLTSSYGLGCSSSEIDDAAAIAAANICDEAVALQIGSPSASHRRYTVNGTVNLADRPVDILRSLTSAGAGAAIFTEGVWKIFAGAFVTPDVDIDEDWLRGPVSVRAKPPRRELFNGVRGTFADSEKFWQPTDFPPVTNSTYETQDGAQQILRDIELPYTISVIRAQRLAKIQLEKSRQGIVVELACNMKAFQVALWDNVRLSLERFGWTDKVFQVLDWKLNPAGGVDLVLQEEASGVYDWDAGDATVVDLTQDTSLQSPFEDLDITIGSPASGTAELFVAGDGTVVPRIRLPFTQPGNPFISYFEVQFARSAGSPQTWQDAPDVSAPADQAYFYPVEDGVAYDGRIRAVTSVGNAGPWSMFHAHTVIGKTEQPSDVAVASAVQQGGLVVAGCNPVEDTDLDAIEIRYHDEGETDWDNATPFSNILRGETVTSGALPPGTWEILFKARDTSGNYSVNAARVTVTVTSSGFTTIEQTLEAPDWLGQKTNMVEHWTGVLTPDSQSLASDLDWEVFDEFVPDAFADCYYEAPTFDTGVDSAARIYGDIVSVLGPGESGIAHPTLQVDHRTSAGAFDGFEEWSVGTVTFRYMKARIYIDTTIGKPVISQFTPTIDALARQESGVLTVDGSGTGSVTFITEFHERPVLQLTPEGSSDVTASYTDLSTTGFTGHRKSGGSAAAGDISYIATGA